MTEQEPECKICTVSIPDTHFVYADDFWRLRHSNETNILGYCILEPCRHFLDLSDGNDAELAAYGKVLAAIMKAQRRILKCQRVYTFSLAEAVPHYHLHVVPRAKDFPRAFKGRGIMSYPTEPACQMNLVANLVQVFKTELRRMGL